MKKNTAFVTPQYEGRSICNILPTIARFNSIKISDGIKRHDLDLSIKKQLLDFLAEAERIVILEIDALGYDLFRKVKSKYSFLSNSIKLSSVFPTYTHTAFTSFVTGTPPSCHGIIAGTFSKKGKVDWMGNFARSEKYSKNLIKCNSLLHEFNRQGKKAISILYDVNDDCYSEYLYPNPHFVSSKSSHITLSKQAQEVEERVFDKILEFSPQKFYILTAYFWFLDGISGEYGKFSQETLDFINFFFKKVKVLKNSFPKRTLFLFMGDHGHTSLKKTVVINESSIEEINKESKARFALDGRVMMFYSKNPTLTKKLFEKEVEGNVMEMTRDDYLKLIGGRCSLEIEDRVGNLIYLAKPHCTVRFKPKAKKATHGGLSRGEMETVFGFFMN